MGYELSIGRSQDNKISAEEWHAFVASNADFSEAPEWGENYFIWRTPQGDIPFHFSKEYGCISVKNPDLWIIEKMVSIAKELNAIVEGEEGEEYNDETIAETKSNFES